MLGEMFSKMAAPSFWSKVGREPRGDALPEALSEKKELIKDICGKQEGAMTRAVSLGTGKALSICPQGSGFLSTHLLFLGVLVPLDLPPCLLAQDPPFLLEVPAAQVPLDYLRMRRRFCRHPDET